MFSNSSHSLLPPYNAIAIPIAGSPYFANAFVIGWLNNFWTHSIASPNQPIVFHAAVNHAIAHLLFHNHLPILKAYLLPFIAGNAHSWMLSSGCSLPNASSSNLTAAPALPGYIASAASSFASGDMRGQAERNSLALLISLPLN